MHRIRKNGSTSNTERSKLRSATLGQGLTGLDLTSAGLLISVQADNEATPTTYDQAGGNIETITTLGTYAAPTAGKCRFKEVDDTASPGDYEFQFADARYAVSGAKMLMVNVSGAAGLLDKVFHIQLTAANTFDDAVRGGYTALPNANAEAAGGLFTRGTGAGQISQEDNGYISVNLKAILRTVLTETTFGWIAAAFKQFFDIGTPTGTMKYLTRVSLVDTVTANTDMRGTDNAASAIALGALQDDVDTLLGRLTASRAGYLDNLNTSGVVATQADINALNQSASRRVILTTVGQYERPDAGTIEYTIEARTYSDDGVPMDATGTPTLAATGQTSGNLSGNLGTITNPSTGVYRWIYTVETADTLEQVRFDFSAVVDGDTIPMAVYTQVCDYTGADFTTADRTKLEAVYNKLPSKNYLAGTNNSDGDVQIDESTGDFNSTQQTRLATQAAVGVLVTPGNKLVTDIDGRVQVQAGTQAGQLVLNSGQVTVSTNNDKAGYSISGTLTTLDALWTKIKKWLQLGFRKDAAIATDNATELAEINADGGSGAGSFASTTDSLQSIRDNLSSGGGGPVTASVVVPAATARAVLQGDTIGVTRGDTLRVSLTDLGDISGRQKLWLTVKQSKEAADSAAIIQIEETDRLTLLNGSAPANSAWGIMTVVDQAAGDVNIVLYASATKLLSKASGLIWDVKQSLGSSPDDATTQMEGKMNVEPSVTQATA